MNSVTEAFRRASNRGGPLFSRYELFRKAEVDADFTGWTADEIKLAKSGKITVYNWLETLPGTLKWQDMGTDGTTDRGSLTLYGEPLAKAPDVVLDDDGQYYVVEAALGRDSMRAAYRLEVKKWVSAAPKIRSAAP